MMARIQRLLPRAVRSTSGGSFMFKNLKIKTKILAVIILLGIVSFSGLLYMVSEIKRVDATYSAFLDNEVVAASLGARSGSSVLTSVLQASFLLNFEPGSPDFNAAAAAGSRFAQARDRLKQSETLVPAQKPLIDEVLAGVDRLEVLTNKAIEQRKGGDAKSAVATMAAINAEMLTLIPKMQLSNDALTNRVNNGGDAVSAQVAKAVDWSLGVLGIATLAAILLGLYVAQAGIALPLSRLQRRMVILAEGDSASGVDGLDRRDEIGQMAAAVAVFRDNAIARAELEEKAPSAKPEGLPTQPICRKPSRRSATV
jgi:methyl-accepting chemotaxis protein